MIEEEIRGAPPADDHLGLPSMWYVDSCQQETKIINEVQPYWHFRDEVAGIERITMKGRKIVIPLFLQKRALDQFHVNHTDMEETVLLAYESNYWTIINGDIENVI